MKGVTTKLVISKAGRPSKVSCPMLQSEYVKQAQRDCVVIPGVSAAYKDWVARKVAANA